MFYNSFLISELDKKYLDIEKSIIKSSYYVYETNSIEIDF